MTPGNLFSSYAFSMLTASFIEELAISLIRKSTQHTSLLFEFFKIFCIILLQYFLKSFCECLSYDTVAPSNQPSFSSKFVIEESEERTKHLNHSPFFASSFIDSKRDLTDSSLS